MKIIFLVTLPTKNISETWYFQDLKLAEEFLLTLKLEQTGSEIDAFMSKGILYDSVEEALEYRYKK